MLTLKQLTATYPHHLVIELYNIFYLRETEGSTWGHPRFLVGSVSLIGLDFCIMLFILCVLVPCLAYPEIWRSLCVMMYAMFSRFNYSFWFDFEIWRSLCVMMYTMFSHFSYSFWFDFEIWRSLCVITHIDTKRPSYLKVKSKWIVKAGKHRIHHDTKREWTNHWQHWVCKTRD
jgi:hypothetical protein